MKWKDRREWRSFVGFQNIFASGGDIFTKMKPRGMKIRGQDWVILRPILRLL